MHVYLQRLVKGKRNMNKRFKGIASMAAAGVLALALAGCGGGGAADSGSAGTDKGAESSYKVTMVTDMGGVNDQSFNELA